MSFAKECKNEIIETLELRACCKKTLIAYFVKRFRYQKNNFYYTFFNQEFLVKLARMFLENFAVEAILDEDTILIAESEFAKFPEIEESQRGCCRTTLLKAAFLHSGTVTKPKMAEEGATRNNYHLEIITTDEEGRLLQRILNGRDRINAVLLERRKHLLLYIKDKEDITGFLKLTGAISQASYFEEVIISKFARATAVRKMNCEMANDYKSASASLKQIKEIQYIKKNLTKDTKISETILDLMETRLKHQDKNLNELREVYAKRNIHLTKSCLNHRFRKISELYEKLIAKSQSQKAP